MTVSIRLMTGLRGQVLHEKLGVINLGWFTPNGKFIVDDRVNKSNFCYII